MCRPSESQQWPQSPAFSRTKKLTPSRAGSGTEHSIFDVEVEVRAVASELKVEAAVDFDADDPNLLTDEHGEAIHCGRVIGQRQVRNTRLKGYQGHSPTE